MKSIGIIGGTGVYTPDFLQNAESIAVKTEFGTVTLMQGELEGRSVFFEARHGTEHTVPPHKINYRANIFSLYKLGVERIIATAAVGSINREILPGTFVIVDQFLDFTKKREDTFFSQGKVVHTDCTDPYCPELATAIQKAMDKFGYPYSPKGTYVSAEGPRFETRAEIRAYSILGGDVVGMTGVPEVVLARELGMCYATIAAVSNYAAGISDQMISHKEVVSKMGEMNEMFRNVLSEAVINIPGERHCYCSKAPTSGE